MFFRDGTAEDLLDDFALTAHADEHFGNVGNWFFSFRMGLHGIRSRLNGLEFHRRLLYDWVKGPPGSNEHHVAVILFSMDSALECLVFSLNALGQAADVKLFRDITNENALRKISPYDVIGSGAGLPLVGYKKYYPSFQQHLRNSIDLLRLVQGNHDVSKHRQHNFSGGVLRSDPPEGYFESLGLTPDDPRAFYFTPMREVLIPKHPKLPMQDRPSDLASWTRLEIVITQFRAFIEQAMTCAHADVTQNFHLGAK